MSDTTRVHELIAGRLFRISSTAPLDGSLSFAASDPDRVETINSYVLTAPGRALLIDSGVRIHSQGVVDAIKGVVGDSLVEMCITRTEPDTIGNVFHLITGLGVRKITIFGNHVHPLDFSNAIEGGPAVVAKGELVVSRQPFDGEYEINGFAIESLAAPLRVLATAWLYSPELRVLFVSDSFGFVKAVAADSDPVQSEPLDPADGVELERFHNNVLAKFGWLAQTRSELILGAVEAAIASRDIEYLASTHGKVLRGRDVFDSHLAALRSLPPAYTIEGD